MWILESNGDFLEGKRMWLRPNKRYLFGRVRKDGVKLAIDHKTVSRKHFLITVGAVKDGDVGNVHARTSIIIEDLASKAGTNIDGELISKASRTLKSDVTSIRPGTCPYELVISWHPCVLTYPLNKKEVKNGMLQAKQERLKELDIKVINEYLPGITTHVISQKRNTAKTLQGLIEGKPLVTEAFTDDLIYAASPSDMEALEAFCNLEADFDDAWPNEAIYLPSAGKEPTTKSDAAYKPNADRVKVFEKCVFFFFTQAQCDMLLAPITVGHGKASFLEIHEKITKVESASKFVHDTIGTSGTAVIIKPSDPESWSGNLVEKLCVKLGQQSADQADLLDAILANDASSLHMPLGTTVDSTGTSTGNAVRANSPQSAGPTLPPPTAQTKPTQNHRISRMSSSSSLSPPTQSAGTSQQASAKDVREPSQQSTTEDANPRPRKRARFAPVLETVKAFDDDFDPDAAVPYDDDDEEEVEAAPSPPKRPQPRATQKSQGSKTKTRVKAEAKSANQRDRSLDFFLDDSDSGMDDLLPGAAALRREQKEAEAKAIREGRPLKINAPTKPEPPKKTKQAKQPIDVREAIRAKRDADEAKVAQEREELMQMQAEDEGKTGPRDLVRIETFALPVRARDDAPLNGYRGEAWKPEWNDRKNYKGFRRARDGIIETRQQEKIIVPVVPWKSGSSSRRHGDVEKTDQHSHKPISQRSSNTNKSALSQRTRQTQQESDSDEHDETFDSSPDEQISPETARLQREAEHVLEHPVDIEAPRQTRHGDTQTQRSTQTSSVSKATRGAKRPASSTPTGRSTTAKKQKIRPIVVDDSDDSAHNRDEDDDSDDMKFTFGGSKKMRQRK